MARAVAFIIATVMISCFAVYYFHNLEGALANHITAVLEQVGK